jgi:acyl-CoA thioester hydrolase
MPYCYDHDHRVPYRDCTPQGLLQPRHYLDYFKAARVHALRALGVRYRSLEDDGILMPVVDARLSSSHPVRYDALLTIRACFPNELSARITTGYTVFPARETDGEAVLATGRVVVCFVSTETRRPIHPPEKVQRALRNAESPSKGRRSPRVA